MANYVEEKTTYTALARKATTRMIWDTDLTWKESPFISKYIITLTQYITTLGNWNGLGSKWCRARALSQQVSDNHDQETQITTIAQKLLEERLFEDLETEKVDKGVIQDIILS